MGALFRLKKSTIVRTGLTGSFAALELISPALGARLATRLWFRIPTVPPTGLDRAAVRPPAGEAFAMTSQGVVVRGTTWGHGRVVYLVHGWGGRSTDLAAFVAPLVTRGLRVVAFDAPSHGLSDAGLLGPGRSHAVETGRALDAVAARFGPAEAVVAHSAGAVAGLLTLKHGWLSTRRIVLLAPMARLADHLAVFRSVLRIGRRTSARMDRDIERLVGLPVTEFDAPRLYHEVAAEAGPMSTLVVHDRDDRTTPYVAGLVVSDRMGAELVTTSGLGHRRLLQDPGVVDTVVGFVAGDVSLEGWLSTGS
ncbi:MAG: alpha/beta fold hydrolase [Nocardioides sp.]